MLSTFFKKIMNWINVGNAPFLTSFNDDDECIQWIMMMSHFKNLNVFLNVYPSSPR
jgi:hypothetical protein